MNNQQHTFGANKFKAELMRRASEGGNTEKNLLSTFNRLCECIPDFDNQFAAHMGNPDQLWETDREFLLARNCRDLRTPKSRLKKLVEIYQLCMPLDDQDFRSLFQVGVQRTFGSLTKRSGEPGHPTLTQVGINIVEFLGDRGFIMAPSKNYKSSRERLKAQAQPYISWHQGRTIPSRSNKEAELLALDELFRFPSGTLAKSLPSPLKASTPTTEPTKKRRPNSDPLPQEVERQFNDFYKLKTGKGVPRTVNYLPGTAPKAVENRIRNTSKKKRWTLNAENVCKTAGHAHSALKGFFTYIATEYLPQIEGQNQDTMSMSWLADVDALDQWIDDALEQERSIAPIKRVLALLDEMSRSGGYLRLGVAPSNGMSVAEWFAEMSKVPDIVAALSERLRYDDGPVRDAKKNIRVFLELTHADAHAKLDEGVSWLLRTGDEHENESYDCLEAHQIACILLISRICPLRLSNWSRIQYLIDNFSTMPRNISSLTYDSKKNKYKLYVPKDHLKNRNTSKVNDIDIDIPQSFNSIIRQLLTSRERFLGTLPEQLQVEIGTSLFINKNRKKHTIGAMNSSALSVIFRRSTKRMMAAIFPDICHEGINMHAMRHLVATLFLNEHPSQYAPLSVLLNDSLAVVIATYAEIDQQKNAEIIGQWVSSMSCFTSPEKPEHA